MTKKRIISLIMGIALLVPILLNITPSVYASSNEGYYSVIENYALDCDYSSLKESDQKKCKGLLYDLDGDGQNELIVQYLKKRSTAYSIWTMENGTPVCALDDPFCTGSEVEMHVTEYNGKSFFVLSSWSAGSDGDYFEWLFYDITNIPYQLAYTLGKASNYDGSGSSRDIVNKAGDGSTYAQVYSSLENKTEILFDSTAKTFDILLEDIQQGNTVKDEHPYIPIVRDTIEYTKSVYSWSDGYGVLYDVDDNGIEELIMVYSANTTHNEAGVVPATVYSVYTMTGNVAVPLIEQEVLYIDVGGPTGYVAITKKDGKKYLVSTAENGEVGPISYRGGNWTVISVNGTSINREAEISYEEVYSYEENTVLYDKSYAVINGTKCDYRTLEAWIAGLNVLVSIDHQAIEMDIAEPDKNVMTLRELLDNLRVLPSVEESIELKAYTAFPESKVGTEQEVKIMFSLYINGKLTPIKEYALGISNPSVIDSTEATDSDGSKIITFKGITPGSSDLTFSDNSTGASITITVTVEDKCNYFRCSAFPMPYESIGSIYVADYSCKINDNGTHDITFNAYNTSYAYGVVEVYDENGSLIKIVPLDPRSDGSGMEKVVNGFKWVWEDIKDLFDGDTPFYTKENSAKHTPVKLDNIPDNAEIIISSDGDASDFATLYTGVDVFVRTVFAASSIDLKTDGQVATVKELMNALADSFIKSISHEETEKMIKQGLIKEATESISTSIAFASSTDSISDIYQTVYNLFQSLDIDAESIMLNVLKGMGYSVADTAFTTVVPLYKIVNFVDLILETAWPLVDYQFNLDRGKMEIHITKHGLQNFVANSAVTVTQQSNFNDNTVLDAYEVVEIDELSGLSDSIPAEMTNYAVYNITLREDGVEVQPNGEIEVRLPVPYGADGEKCVVYRIEENGERTLLQSRCEGGYITFTTSHLSYYVVGQSTETVPPVIADDPNSKYWGMIGVGVLVLGSIILVTVLAKRKKLASK